MNDTKIHRLADHRQIPRLDEPATVTGLTIVVGILCKQCDATSAIGLLNGQPAVCESCGAVYSLDAVAWEKGAAAPQVRLSASPSRAAALVT